MGPVREAKAKNERNSPYARPSASSTNVSEEQDEVLVLEDLGLPKSAEQVLGTKVPNAAKRKKNLPREQSSDDVKIVFEDLGHDGRDGTPEGEARHDSKCKPENEKKDKGAEPRDTGSSDETMVDYYRVLELPRTATTVEIKKSYRRLALRWHPDKNPNNTDEATKRFREISEAYEVLADDKKRKIYDQYGKEGLSGNAGRGPSASSADFGFGFPTFDAFGFGFGGFPGFTFRDPEDVFREFFRGDPMADLMDDFFGGGLFPGSRNRPSNRNGRPQEQSLSTAFFQPFGFGMFNTGFDNMFPANDAVAGTDFFSSTTFGGTAHGNSPNVKRTSTSSKIVNGKKIVTKKVFENGTETVTVTENGVLKSKTVNGVPQAIAF